MEIVNKSTRIYLPYSPIGGVDFIERLPHKVCRLQGHRHHSVGQIHSSAVLCFTRQKLLSCSGQEKK